MTFGIKCYNKTDVDHLLDKIRNIYNYTSDWDIKYYFVMTFDWNYDKGYVDISMPRYVEKSLQRLQYKTQTTPQYSTHPYTTFKLGVKGIRQYRKTPDTSPLLSPKDTIYIQSVTGTFLYYACEID